MVQEDNTRIRGLWMYSFWQRVVEPVQAIATATQAATDSSRAGIG